MLDLCISSQGQTEPEQRENHIWVHAGSTQANQFIWATWKHIRLCVKHWSTVTETHPKHWREPIFDYLYANRATVSCPVAAATKLWKVTLSKTKECLLSRWSIRQRWRRYYHTLIFFSIKKLWQTQYSIHLFSVPLLTDLEAIYGGKLIHVSIAGMPR